MSDNVVSSVREIVDCEEIYTELEGDQFQRMDKIWRGMQCLNRRMDSLDGKVDRILDILSASPSD